MSTDADNPLQELIANLSQEDLNELVEALSLPGDEETEPAGVQGLSEEAGEEAPEAESEAQEEEAAEAEGKNAPAADGQKSQAEVEPGYPPDAALSPEAFQPADDQPPAPPKVQDQQPTGRGHPAHGTFVEYLRNAFGQETADELVAKYGNEHEIVKGLLAAHKLVGSRATQPQQPAQQEPAGVHYDPEWFTTKVRFDHETGKYVPGPEGDENDVKEFQKFVKHRERLLSEFAANPRAFLDKVLEDLPGRIKQELSQEFAGAAASVVDGVATVANTYRTLESFLAANQQLLFVNGDPAKGYSKLGSRMLQINEELAQKSPALAQDHVTRAELSLKLAKAEFAPKPVPQAPSPKAKRVTQSTPRRSSVEDLIEQGYSLAEAFAAGNQ